MAIEQERDVAEKKLFKGIISDDAFTRNREKFTNELNLIQDKLDKLEEQREVKIDEVQEILRFARNIYSAYKKAPYILKRHYLGFFWDRFEVKNKELVKSEPSKLFKALMETNEVIIRPEWGPIRDTFRTLDWGRIKEEWDKFKLKEVV